MLKMHQRFWVQNCAKRNVTTQRSKNLPRLCLWWIALFFYNFECN